MGVIELAHHPLDGREGGLQHIQQAPSLLGQRHVAGSAVEQPYLQLLLQPLQVLGKGGASHPHLGGGLGEAAVAGDVGKPRQ